MSADITVTVSSTRLFPSSQTSPPRVVPLSILDCSVGNFSPTGATWVFDAPSSPVAIDVGPAEHLELSLVETLGAYPQWAGQLRYTAYSPSAAERDHTLRSRRLEIAYGNGAGVDPGVAFVVARCASRVADVFPSLEERVCGSGAFDATALNAEALGLFPTTLTLSNGDAESTAAGLPCLIAQITTFACGGVAIALKSAHPMADAQTLVAFVDDWAAVSRSLLYGASLPVLAPVFDPAAIDRTAAGDIDAPQPDAGVLAVARELPIHRYDWWARADGEGGLDEKRIPAHLRGTALHPGRPLPWHEWDLTLPIKNYLLYFSKGEVDRIWGAAAAEDLSAEHRISRLDALQAHIWQVLMRAYPAADEGEEFYMNLSLGMRTRVAPPLPFNALGSPILLARARACASATLPQLARAIRTDVLAQFTPARVSAVLHEMAHDVDARRMWGAFLGRRNVIVTSWARVGVYEVDFGFSSDGDEDGGGEGGGAGDAGGGGGGKPRFVQPVMPVMEGIVQVMEAGPGGGGGGGRWYEEGVSVSVMFPVEVVERMLVDPLLRKYLS